MHAARSSSRTVQTLRRHGRAIVLAGLAVSVVGSAASILRPKEYAAVAHVRLAADGGLVGPEFLRRATAAGERLIGHDAFAAQSGRLGVDAAVEKFAQSERIERTEAMFAEMRARTTYTVEASDSDVATAAIVCRGPDRDGALRVVSALAEHAPSVRFDDDAV